MYLSQESAPQGYQDEIVQQLHQNPWQNATEWNNSDLTIDCKMLQKTKESINWQNPMRRWEDCRSCQWELQIQSNDHFEISKTNENLCRTNEKLQKIDAPRPLIIFATRAACQIVGDWLAASVRIIYRGHRGQQKRKLLLSRLNQNHFIYYHNQTISDSNINHSLTRSIAEPDLLRSHAETCHTLLSCCSRVLRAQLQNCKAIDHRGHRSRCCRPDPAAPNMHQKPMRIYAELFRQCHLQGSNKKTW